MSLAWFTLVVLAVAFLAGLLGSLTGLGGGVVITPALVLLFGVNFRYAAGASIIAVLATSSAAAPRFMREGLTNLRIALFLELGAVAGAIGGAIVASLIPIAAILGIFAIVLLYSAIDSLKAGGNARPSGAPDPLAERLGMAGSFEENGALRSYSVRRLGAGTGVLVVAGLLSGLLGIGSGALKVLAMDRLMKLPYKISTATSNFMIGITAAAGAGVYFDRGYVSASLAAPVMIGSLAGAYVGANVLVRAPSRSLRIVFAVVVALLGCDMLYGAIRGIA